MTHNCRFFPRLSIGLNLFDLKANSADKTYMDAEQLNDLLARNMESLMHEKGLNASAWAKAAGMGHTGVRDILLKNVKNPTYRTLLNLADAAGVDVRRITVGPDFKEIDETDAEALHVLSQLKPEARAMLLNAAKVQIESQDPPPKQSDSNDQ